MAIGLDAVRLKDVNRCVKGKADADLRQQPHAGVVDLVYFFGRKEFIPSVSH